MKKISKKLVSIILCLSILMSVMPLSLINVYAASINNFEVSLNWGSYSGTTNYDWNASRFETKKITLKVNYKNDGDNAVSYEPNALSIKLSGIGKANRDGAVEAYKIAADKSSAENKSYKWSYAWNKETDEYTFTNNETLDVGVSGSFEIIWNLTSTNTIDGYNTKIKAVVSGENISAESNEVTYSESRVKNTFNISVSAKDEDPVANIDSDKTYLWVGYSLTLNETYYSLSLKEINGLYSYFIYHFSEDALVYDGNGNLLTPSSTTNGISEYIITNQTLNVAYPCERILDEQGNVLGYEANETTMDVFLKGTYLDHENAEETLAFANKKYTINDASKTSIIYGTRTWAFFTTDLLGNQSESLHEKYSNYKKDNHCNNSGWIEQKDIYNKNDKYTEDNSKDATLRINNIWVKGINTSFYDVFYNQQAKVNYNDSKKGLFQFYWTKEVDGNSYVTINSSYSTLHKEANNIEQLISVFNTDLNDFYYNIEFETKLIDTYKDKDGKITNYDIQVTANYIDRDNDKIYNTLTVDVNVINRDKNSVLKDYYSPEYLQGLSVVGDYGFVRLNNGNSRRLNDDEYNWTSVTIPSLENVVTTDKTPVPLAKDSLKVDIYGRAVGEKDYKLIESRNITTDEQVVYFPDNICAFKVNILKTNIDADYVLYNNLKLDVNIDYHLKKDDPNLDSNICVNDTDGAFDMFTYYQYIDYKNSEYVEEKLGKCPYIATTACADNLEIFDNFVRIDKNYSDENKFELVYDEYDKKEYGHTVTRLSHTNNEAKDTPEVDIHERRNTLTPKLSFSTPEKERNSEYIYDLSATLSSSFNCVIKDKPLTKFSMFALLPKGVFIDKKSDDEEILLKNADFSAYGKDFYYSKDIKKYVKLTRINNYRDTGLVYVKFDFDFTGSDILLNIKNPYANEYNNINVTLNNLKYDTLGEGSSSGGYIGTIIYDDALTNFTSKDDGSYFKTNKYNYSDIYKDFDNNGNTEDLIKYAFGEVKLDTVAQETYRQSSLFVSSDLTNSYTKSSSSVVRDDTYSYKILFSTGLTDAFYGIDIVDMFEQENGSEWQGVFESVSCSINGSYSPKVYYTTVPAPTDSDWSLTVPQDKSTIKGIRIKLDASTTGTDTYLYGEQGATITMKAPSKEAIGKTTKNAYTAKYLLTKGNTNWSTLKSNTISLKCVNTTGKIILIKEDETNKEPLADAVFDLYSSDDILYFDGITTDENGKVIIPNVPYGEYYFKETTAPYGYEVSDDKFYVTLENNNAELTVTNQRKKGTVTLTKLSADRYLYNENCWDNMYGETSTIEGVVFNVYDKNDKLIQSGITTDKNGKATISDLEWGSYYLKEVKAPEGYLLADKNTAFAVTRDNVDESIPVTIENVQKKAYMQVQLYEMNDDGTLTDIPIKNGSYAVYSSDLLKAYTSNSTNAKGVAEFNNYLYGEYKIKEKAAPTGYELSDEVFSAKLGAENCDTPLTFIAGNKRKKGKISFYKTDDTDTLVSGAEYGIYNSKDELVSTATTNNKGMAQFTDLQWDDYYIKEISAPAGYTLSDEKFYITINKDNVETEIILSVKDNTVKGSVKLIKTDYDNGDLLEGAVYNLYSAGDNALIKENLKTNAVGEIIVDNLNWGSYYFKEKEAPAMYCLSDEKINFSVNYITAKEQQTVTAEDIKTNESVIEISKNLPVSDINYAQGVPTFLYEINGLGENYKSIGYNTSISFTKEAVDNYLKENPNSENIVLSVKVIAKEKGTYTVSEKNVNRYSFNSVTNLVNGTPKGNGKTEFVLTKDCYLGKVTYLSNKSINSGITANTFASNTLSTGTDSASLDPRNKLTAKYNEEVLSSNTIDRNNLTVSLKYNDGTEKILDNDEYTLDKEAFDTSRYSSNTVKVTYVEDGVTYKTSFNIVVQSDKLFSYHTLEDGTLAIDGYLGNDDIVYFPSKINDRTVSMVGSIADFSEDEYSVDNIPRVTGLENVSTILISDNIKAIGDYAFNRISESSYENDTYIPAKKYKIKLGTGVSRIGTAAFAGNEGVSFDNIVLNNCSYIGNDAFHSSYNSSVFADVVINGCNIYIGQRAFSNCVITNELSITGENVIIDDSAFYYLNNNYSFRDTDKLCNINLKGISLIEHNGFRESQFKNLTIEGTGEESTIKNYAFYAANREIGYWNMSYQELVEYYKDKSITISNIGSFEYDSFGDTDVFLGALTITGCNSTIGSSAFYSFGNLHGGYSENIYNKYSKITLLGTFKEFGENSFGYAKSCGDLIIPPVEKIGDAAFCSLRYLNSIVLPDNLKTIGNRAFYDCIAESNNSAEGYPQKYKYSDMVIPASVTDIGDYAFSNNRSLAGRLVLDKNSNIKFGSNAFSNCQNMTEVIGANNISNYSVSMFSDCLKLENIEGFNKNSEYFSSTFENTPFEKTLADKNGFVIKNDVLIRYYGTETDLNVPDGIKEIGSTVIKNNTVKNVILSDSVLKLDNYAFTTEYWYNESILETISGNFIKEIGSGAFKDCAKLYKADFSNAENICSEAFAGTNLSEVYFPKLLTVSSNLFENCPVLQSAVFSQATSIEDFAFANCPNLKNVLFPNVKTIGRYAFNGCTSLTNVSFPNVETIDYDVFRDCNNLSSVDIKNVKTLNSYAFGNCTNLKELDLSNVETINSSIISGCVNINHIIIGNKVTEIDDSAFAMNSCNNKLVIDINMPENSIEKAPWNYDWYGNNDDYFNDIVVNWLG